MKIIHFAVRRMSDNLSLVERVLRRVDRADFVKQFPYEDAAQPIGHQATISAPHMHKYALTVCAEKCDEENLNILDVGSGSGYLTACFAEMFGPSSHVTGIDHIPELVNDSIENIRKHHSHLITSGRLEMVVGDGRNGYQPRSPYDIIHVGAALEEPAEETMQPLLEQLKPGGLFIAPCGPEWMQEMTEVRKDSRGNLITSRGPQVLFMPLTSVKKQLSRRPVVRVYF